LSALRRNFAFRCVTEALLLLNVWCGYWVVNDRFWIGSSSTPRVSPLRGALPSIALTLRFAASTVGRWSHRLVPSESSRARRSIRRHATRSQKQPLRSALSMETSVPLRDRIGKLFSSRFGGKRPSTAATASSRG
jgi:hypothetical protein